VEKLRKKRINGFTLAEVLITLGIIGVVAALTIPTLIANQQKAALRSQFAKSSALINNVVNQLITDKGITDLQVEYCSYYNTSCITPEYAGMSPVQKLAKDFIPYTDNVGSRISDFDYTKNPIDTRPQICNIDATVCTNTVNYHAGLQGSIPYSAAIYLRDGAIINFGAPSAAWPQIIFDTNGNKGPNKFGYDIFYWILKGTKAVPTSYDYGDGQDCQLSGGIYSGVTCAQYAIVDQCPWDATKGYWEALP